MKNVCLLLALLAVSAGALTGEEILTRMDRYRTYRTIRYEGTMTIHTGDETRVKHMRTVGLHKDETKAIVEFTNPEDEGTKYLMLGNNLWIFFPEEEEVVKISGHLLKEGMMGSDVSYEDALSSDKLSEKYAITLGPDTTIEGRPCYVVTLGAKVRDVPYDKRIMCVDKERFVQLREEMYAKSGKLLKVSTTQEVKKIGDRWFAVTVEMANKLRRNSRTVFAMEHVDFNTPVDETMFSIRYLQR